MSMPVYQLNLLNQYLLLPNQGQLIAERYSIIIARCKRLIESILVSTHSLFSIRKYKHSY